MSMHRQLSCLMLLQNVRKQTAAQLAAQLAVSVRTVYRDVETLSGAGIPIRMERGVGGGIVLADDYRRVLAAFTDDDIAALFAASAAPMRDLGVRDASGALQKLASALNERQRKAADDARGTVFVDHERWYRPEQPKDALAVLRRAVDDRTWLAMRYRDRGGAPSERRVAPLGLVSKAGVWYLVAREAGKGDRTFRVDRLAAFAPSAERFARPADFDLGAHWRASIAAIERRDEPAYEFTLRLRPDLADRIVPSWGGTVVETHDDAIVVRFRFHDADMAGSLVVALGDAAEIVAPPGLRTHVVDRARAALAHHDRPLSNERLP